MKKICSVVSSLMLLFVVGLIILLALPKIIGLQPLAVLSGSMEPKYPVGSLIYVKDTPPQKIHVGDVITYYISEDTMVTHRVIKKDDSSQSFETKGDANDIADGGKVSFTSVVGTPILCIPYLGYAAIFFSQKTGVIVIAGIIVTLLLMTFLPDMVCRHRNLEIGGEA